MFYYISGEYVHAGQGFAVVDCAGVGYRLTVSTTAAARIGRVGDKVKVYTYLHVREDGIELFGFYSMEEHSSFQLLTSVSGVGPKAAMSVLSTLSPESFAMVVASGDAKGLTRCPGVGMKTAQRIILELKDKIAKDFASQDDMSGGDIVSAPSKMSDAINALAVLGYSRSEAAAAIKGCDQSAPLEEIIKAALKGLMKK